MISKIIINKHESIISHSIQKMRHSSVNFDLRQIDLKIRFTLLKINNKPLHYQCFAVFISLNIIFFFFVFWYRGGTLKGIEYHGIIYIKHQNQRKEQKPAKTKQQFKLYPNYLIVFIFSFPWRQLDKITASSHDCDYWSLVSRKWKLNFHIHMILKLFIT